MHARTWILAAAVLVGAAAGLGLFTFGYAREIAAQVARDSTLPTVKVARDYQRKAQFLADFIEAENSMGFHADQEAARVLAKSIDYSRRGQVALRGAEPPPVTNPAKGPVAARP